MMHLVAYETSGSEAALTALTPVPDGTMAIQGSDFLVPKDVPNIVCAAAMINSAAATLRAEIQTPTLRSTFNFDISPINNGLVFGPLPRLVRMWQTPLALTPLEPMDAFVQNGAAVMNRVLLWMSDGPVKPVNGKIFTIRATGAASLVTASWVNTALTFGQTLPSGRYQVVGFRAWGANLIAARLFFKGGVWRPGVPAVNTENDGEWDDFRFGGIGVLGEFDNTTPPTVDCFGITDTAQTFFLDLVKVG